MPLMLLAATRQPQTSSSHFLKQVTIHIQPVPRQRKQSVPPSHDKLARDRGNVHATTAVECMNFFLGVTALPMVPHAANVEKTTTGSQCADRANPQSPDPVQNLLVDEYTTSRRMMKPMMNSLQSAPLKSAVLAPLTTPEMKFTQNYA